MRGSLRSLTAAALLLGASPALAQPDLPSRGAPLAQRIAAVRDGTVRLTFTVRPDVCGDGNNIRIIRNGSTTYRDDGWRRSRDVEWDVDCQTGPGRLAMDVRGGEVQDLRFYVG